LRVGKRRRSKEECSCSDHYYVLHRDLLGMSYPPGTPQKVVTHGKPR
jgi:hypothetical protein